MTDNNILKAVESAEEDFRKAERKFDEETSALRIKAARAPISLALTVEEELYNLQGQANYNAKIVEEFASVTADYRATCEAIILSLDTICRPLLQDNPSVMVIGRVSRFISKIIEDVSNVKIDFSVSLNSSNLGDIGSFNPKPSVTVQTIERLWKEAYKGHPDYVKDEKRIRDEKDAEERRISEREKTLKDELNKAIAREKKIINDAAFVTEKRELVIAESDKKISDLKEKLFAEALRLKALMIDTEKERLQSELENAKEELKVTRFFDFSNKKVLKAKISTFDQYLKNPAVSPNIAQQLNDIDKIADKNLSQYKDKVNAHISARFSIVETRRDFGAPSTNSEWDYEKMLEILNFLASKEGPQKFDDIFESSGCESNLMFRRLIRELHSQGFLVRSENHGKVYFAISPDINVVTIEIWKENSIEAKRGIPSPPTDIQELFK